MRGKALKWILLSLVLLLIIGSIVGWYAYSIVYGSNVSDRQDSYELFIPTGADFETVIDSLKSNKIIKDEWAFRWVADRMQYPEKVKSGKYLIKSGGSSREILNLLRSGKQEPIKVTINSARDLSKMIGTVGKKLEADSTKLLNMLESETYTKELGYTPETVSAFFLPDTYEFFWNTDEQGFIDRMKKEHDKFWTDERKAKATAVKLNPFEVSTLASIVQEEAYHNDEMDDIAGVYLNRLKKGMLLQADPTVKYAVGDFTLKRVLNVHLETESPYNTYLNAGLPPGPICMPSKNAINAVLNPAEHKFLYFCAKDDFSMYHAFATNLRQHLINARRYQSALNKKRIF